MGVGLKRFIQEEIPGAHEIVSIEQQLEKWKCNNSGDPVIIIDFAGFYNSVCKSLQAQLDLLFGKHERLLNSIEKILLRFRTTGAKLIFCYGSRKPSRYTKPPDLTSNHRLGCLEPIEQILIMIKDKRSPEDIVETLRYRIHNNSSFSMAAKILCQKYGSVNKSFGNDCVRDMVVYATKHNAVAIISGTSDLILINGEWKVWEVEKLDLPNFKILQIDKTKVRDFLELTDDELALFGVLTGKRFPNDLVINFLKRFGNHKNVAQFISKYLRTSREPRQIARILSPNDINKNAEIIENTLRLFNNRTDSESLVEDELSIVVKQIHNSHIYEFLNDGVISIEPLYLCKSDYKKFITAALEIHCRQMGVVLQHKHTEQRRLVICSRDSYFKDEMVNPVYPFIEVPLLLRLYQVATDDTLLATKLKLLCWIASDQLDYLAVENIKNKQYLCAVLTLVNMVENQFISHNEADFILYCLHNANSKSMDSCEHPSSITERPLWLVFLYDKFYQYMIYSMNTVGLSDFVVENQLDGIYFHKQYEDFIQLSGAAQDNLLKKYENIEDYRLYI